MTLLSRLISEFAGGLRARYGERLLPGHERALSAMQVCRTEHSPMLVVRCAACGQCETLPHSCGHRSCPHCQHHEGQQWLERQRAKREKIEKPPIPCKVCGGIMESIATRIRRLPQPIPRLQPI